VVLNVPIEESSENFAVGQMVAYAKVLQTQLHWAKDIILVFSEHGIHGATAFMEGYSSHLSTSSHESLEARAGSITAGLVLKFNKYKMNIFNLKLEGFNGQLPNLDLFNTVVRLIGKHQFASTINGMTFKELRQYDFFLYLRSTMNMVKQQFWGQSSGNHAAFLRHKVECLTLETDFDDNFYSYDGRKSGGKIVEHVLRSLNNLEERFHQSFFFYLLPGLQRYISIGLYMPPLGLIVLAPLVQVLCMHFGHLLVSKEDVSDEKSNDGKQSENEKNRLTEEEKFKESNDDIFKEAESAREQCVESSKDTDKSNKISDNFKETERAIKDLGELMSNLGTEDEQKSTQEIINIKEKTDHDMVHTPQIQLYVPDKLMMQCNQLVVLAVYCMLVGAVLSYLPQFVDSNKLFVTTCFLEVASVLIGLKLKFTSDPVVLRKCKEFSLIVLCVAFGMASIVNFSFAFISSACIFPFILFSAAAERGNSKFMKVTSTLFLTYISPCVMTAFYFRNLTMIHDFVQNLYYYDVTMGVWTWSFATLVYFPAWLNLMLVSVYSISVKNNAKDNVEKKTN